MGLGQVKARGPSLRRNLTSGPRGAIRGRKVAVSDRHRYCGGMTRIGHKRRRRIGGLDGTALTLLLAAAAGTAHAQPQPPAQPPPAQPPAAQPPAAQPPPATPPAAQPPPAQPPPAQPPPADPPPAPPPAQQPPP